MVHGGSPWHARRSTETRATAAYCSDAHPATRARQTNVRLVLAGGRACGLDGESDDFGATHGLVPAAGRPRSPQGRRRWRPRRRRRWQRRPPLLAHRQTPWERAGSCPHAPARTGPWQPPRALPPCQSAGSSACHKRLSYYECTLKARCSTAYTRGGWEEGSGHAEPWTSVPSHAVSSHTGAATHHDVDASASLTARPTHLVLKGALQAASAEAERTGCAGVGRTRRCSGGWTGGGAQHRGQLALETIRTHPSGLWNHTATTASVRSCRRHTLGEGWAAERISAPDLPPGRPPWGSP